MKSLIATILTVITAAPALAAEPEFVIFFDETKSAGNKVVATASINKTVLLPNDICLNRKTFREVNFGMQSGRYTATYSDAGLNLLAPVVYDAQFRDALRDHCR